MDSAAAWGSDDPLALKYKAHANKFTARVETYEQPHPDAAQNGHVGVRVVDHLGYFIDSTQYKAGGYYTKRTANLTSDSASSTEAQHSLFD